MDLLEVRWEAKRPLFVGTFILVFLSIFTKSQALSPFESLNSAHLSKSQMDVRPSVQKRLRTMAFSRVATVILGFLAIFNKTQASSSFEALNTACPSRCQSDVRPPFQMWWGSSSFSRVSKRDSDIPSSCEMKDEPAFKPLQGNPAFF